jgi:hypothetical protein
MKETNPIRGQWYSSLEKHPEENVKVLCCFPGTSVFWVDSVHDFGECAGWRWAAANTLVNRTNVNCTPFAWQLPKLSEAIVSLQC